MGVRDALQPLRARLVLVAAPFRSLAPAAASRHQLELSTTNQLSRSVSCELVDGSTCQHQNAARGQDTR